MSGEWSYQIRIDLPAPLATAVHSDPHSAALKPLLEVLARHRAALSCVYTAFAGFVAEAEKQGDTANALYRWTKATIEDPEKKEKYLKSFTLQVDGEEVYSKPAADTLEAALRPLAEAGLILRIHKNDTNPANNPQAPAHFHQA
jgi:hypothetical protein